MSSCGRLCCSEHIRAAAASIPEGSVHGERANFGRLVLGCIDSYDSESRRIFSDFSRSTRFSPLRTALNPKFQQKTCQFFHNFAEISQNFPKFRSNFAKFQRNFAGISPKCQALNTANPTVRSRSLSPRSPVRLRAHVLQCVVF